MHTYIDQTYPCSTLIGFATLLDCLRLSLSALVTSARVYPDMRLTSNSRDAVEINVVSNFSMEQKCNIMYCT